MGNISGGMTYVKINYQLAIVGQLAQEVGSAEGKLPPAS